MTFPENDRTDDGANPDPRASRPEPESADVSRQLQDTITHTRRQIRGNLRQFQEELRVVQERVGRTVEDMQRAYAATRRMGEAPADHDEASPGDDATREPTADRDADSR